MVSGSGSPLVSGSLEFRDTGRDHEATEDEKVQVFPIVSQLDEEG